MARQEPRLKPWILLVLPVTLVLLRTVLAYVTEAPTDPPARRHQITYTDFKMLVEQGNVEEIVVRGEAAGVPFFSITGSQFIEVFVGVGAARVRNLFQTAKRRAALEREETLERDRIEACLGRRASGEEEAHECGGTNSSSFLEESGPRSGRAKCT